MYDTYILLLYSDGSSGSGMGAGTGLIWLRIGTGVNAVMNLRLP
jgi:hypothetical protein